VIRRLALRYGWTFDQILDMPLDQIELAWEAEGEDRAGGGGGAGGANDWEAIIRSPDRLNRLWEECQSRRRLSGGG
jgi:hypothetical protein